LVTVFTIVTDAFSENARPFNLVTAALPGVEKVTPLRSDDRALHRSSAGRVNHGRAAHSPKHVLGLRTIARWERSRR
jgi:hypothetical protein